MRTFRLLIIDDDVDHRTLTTFAAQKSGRYQAIAAAEGGRAALDRLHSCLVSGLPLPDIILTDIFMPEMDGIAFTSALKQDPSPFLSAIPLVMYTGSSSPVDRDKALKSGCIAVLPKPPRFGDLTAMMASLPDLCGLGSAEYLPPVTVKSGVFTLPVLVPRTT